ncbi:MAG TPA: GntR family transcriptional regulator [Acetobacteraceae bacterium]
MQDANVTKSATTAQTSQPVPAFSKAGFAYDALRRKILHGVYKPGDRLRLAQLARELNLSEMPVREALRLLQKDGLVTMHLHRGAEVATLSYQRGQDVTEARMTLEKAAALAALPLHDAASLAELARLLGTMERAASRPVRFALQNRAFWTALLAPCPNRVMHDLIQELWDQVWQASSTSVFAVMPHRVQETVAENRAILSFMMDRNATRLRSAMDRRRRKTIAAWQQAVRQAAMVSSPTQRKPAPQKI